MKRFLTIGLISSAMFMSLGCDEAENTADKKQQKAQEQLLQEGNNQVGMPAIKNFRERKIMKDILEMRDQDNLLTYTYVFSEQTGKFTYLGASIGYPIPYATQFTNPEKTEYRSGGGYTTLPQADPNGLFSPAAAEGSWVMLANPQGKPTVVYVEPRVIALPFKLPANIVLNP